ncbi:MAG TPA: ARMT1-like domain-containing protein [Methanomassiliicoccales archaeon]|nr:ARMT1-like domain-containing protein [Methanomassiliicoccales archaeon]
MKFAADCVPCLLTRVIYETDLIDPSRREEAVRGALSIIADGYPRGANSALLATKVHRRVYDIIGNDDPYLDLKRRSNDAAKAVLDKAERFVDRSEDRLEAACLVAIVGNIMDFGIDVGLEGPESFGRAFDEMLAQGIDVNEVHKMRAKVKAGSKVAYIVDNCGEIVLDRFLVQELQALGANVVGVVKGEAILTDATVEDLHQTGMIDVFDSHLDTGVFAVGLDLGRAPGLASFLVNCDLIVSKGMANFEYLSDQGLPDVIYLLRTKCRPVATAIGAEKGQNVVRMMG